MLLYFLSSIFRSWFDPPISYCGIAKLQKNTGVNHTAFFELKTVYLQKQLIKATIIPILDGNYLNYAENNLFKVKLQQNSSQ